ncbi:MAG: YihA family ribosome biogenesis GTP-binding protein [Rhodospirillales bacterium]|nr:YihA family ribosome biogenesis GTP-binding protein [Rhodospirillales bacterium]
MDEAEIEAGRLLFAGPCGFVAGAARIEALPPTAAPEIAFAGRSNVGKSSLLNALTGRTALARTSKEPGRTQQINFFDLGGRLTLVDLPGYGFARVSKRQKREWSGLIRDYLRGRPTLRRTLVLVDSRHGLKDSDRSLFDLLDEAAVNYQIVLTKADALLPGAAERAREASAAELARHVAAHPEIAITSAQTGAGIPALRATLAGLATLG